MNELKYLDDKALPEGKKIGINIKPGISANEKYKKNGDTSNILRKNTRYVPD